MEKSCGHRWEEEEGTGGGLAGAESMKNLSTALFDGSRVSMDPVISFNPQPGPLSGSSAHRPEQKRGVGRSQGSRCSQGEDEADQPASGWTAKTVVPNEI